MAYNGYDNRRGGGNYRGNYRDNGYRNDYGRGGYNDRGGYYPNQGYQPQPQDFPCDIGQVVIHKYTGEELTVIRFGREQVECRLPNLSSDWFYIHELEAKPAGK